MANFFCTICPKFLNAFSNYRLFIKKTFVVWHRHKHHKLVYHMKKFFSEIEEFSWSIRRQVDYTYLGYVPRLRASMIEMKEARPPLLPLVPLKEKRERERNKRREIARYP